MTDDDGNLDWERLSEWSSADVESLGDPPDPWIDGDVAAATGSTSKRALSVQDPEFAELFPEIASKLWDRELLNDRRFILKGIGAGDVRRAVETQRRCWPGLPPEDEDGPNAKGYLGEYLFAGAFGIPDHDPCARKGLPDFVLRFEERQEVRVEVKTRRQPRDFRRFLLAKKACAKYLDRPELRPDVVVQVLLPMRKVVGFHYALISGWASFDVLKAAPLDELGFDHYIPFHDPRVRPLWRLRKGAIDS